MFNNTDSQINDDLDSNNDEDDDDDCGDNVIM